MSLNRNPPSSLQHQLDKLSLQTIDSLPDELLLPIFDNLSAFERALLLRICRKWNQVILLHTPFWQYLHLSDSFSPSSIVKILSIFNERSGCRLKQVIIETEITTVKQLNRIFVQLKRSGSSLNLLALRQDWKLNGKTRSFAMQNLPMLVALNTFSDFESFQVVLARLFEQGAGIGIRKQIDDENHETGLRFLGTEALLGLTREDLKWLSKLTFLTVIYTDNILSMRRILETAEYLVNLDLSGWKTVEETSSSTIRSLSLESGPACLRDVAEICSPFDVEFTSALVQMLEIDGDKTILSGTADSLVLWKVTGLKTVLLYLTSRAAKKEAEILVGKAKKLFQLNPTIQSLTLTCYQGGYGGDQHHINQILGILDTSDQFQIQSTTIGGEGSSSSSVDNLVLPHLVQLTIQNPTKLDGNLLQKIVKSRTEGNSQFRLEVTITDTHSSEVVAIDDWEARGWMN